MSNRVLVSVLCGVIVLNALWFTASAAIPVPSSDAWYFIDTFVRKALGHELHFTDFFAQRFAGDHSQPLQRLVLLTHLGFADLDFRIEALVGTFFGVLTCALLARELLFAAHTHRQRRQARWGAVAIFGVGLSLNSTMLYTWSLVSLAWISLLAAVVYWRLAAASSSDGRYAVVMALVTFAVSMVTDEIAFPIFAAAVAAVLLRDGMRRPRRAMLLLASGGLGLFAARWLIGIMAHEAAAATSGSLPQLLETLRNREAWKLIVGPLADSVIHQQHLATWFPRSLVLVQVCIAAILALLHVIFWWRALVPGHRPEGRVLVLAVACMLFFYASIGGIALSRVGTYGIEYVHQPRYVAIYVLNLVALLLMFSAPVAADAHADGIPAGPRRLAIAFAAVVLLLQVPLSQNAWVQAGYVRAYARQAAVALAAVARDPADGTAAAKCPPILTVCNAPADVRIRTIALMREHGLSIFSARFRAAHGLEDLNLSPATPAHGESNTCDVRILKRGPMQISKGGAFHRQANGYSAFWLMVPPETAAFVIAFEGHPVAMNRHGGVATFLFDDRQAQAVRAGRPLRFDLLCAGRQVGSFQVAVQ
jgi:hypothetical protein